MHQGKELRKGLQSIKAMCLQVAQTQMTFESGSFTQKPAARYSFTSQTSALRAHLKPSEDGKVFLIDAISCLAPVYPRRRRLQCTSSIGVGTQKHSLSNSISLVSAWKY